MGIQDDPALQEGMTKLQVLDACYYHHGRGLVLGFLAGMVLPGFVYFILHSLG